MKVNLKKMYIVFKPTKYSERVDVFKGESETLYGLMLMFKGGLQAKNVRGIFSTKAEAQQVANAIYKKYNIKY